MAKREYGAKFLLQNLEEAQDLRSRAQLRATFFWYRTLALHKNTQSPILKSLKVTQANKFN